MPKLFYGNFSFEHQLAGDYAGELPGRLRRLDAEMAAVWEAVAETGDCIWMPERPNERPDGLTLCPWGWSAEVVRFARKSGLRIDAPPLDVVRQANGRGFSFDLERKFGCGPEDAAVVESLDELHAAIKEADGVDERWVVKAEFGMSARERVLGQGNDIPEPDRNWIRKRLAADGWVYFEPWLNREAEAGLQFTVGTDGQVSFDGTTLLLTDRHGRYLGSRFASDATFDDEWGDAIDVGLQVAARLSAMGYFGPLGIDAMRYRDSASNQRLRAIQDINARYTMGAMALGFRRRLKPGEFGSWLHVRWPCAETDASRVWSDDLRDQLPSGVRMDVTSPFVVGEHPVAHGTLLLIADDSHSLEAAEAVTVTRLTGS